MLRQLLLFKYRQRTRVKEQKSDRVNAHGVVVGDPLEELKVGANIHFQPKPFQFKVEPSEATVSNWDLFEGTLLMVCFTGQEEQRIIGTAVMVAPGVAISATHVIQPELDALLQGKLVVSCHGLTSHGLQIWSVRKVTAVPGSDITILGIGLISSLPPENYFPLPVITTRSPKIGEEICIWGFRASKGTFALNDDGQGVASSGNLWVGNGLVTERYPTGRDKVMLPWPVMEVDCPTRGGMSGGPVYDMNGLLVGLLCSSLETAHDGGVSYISMLWPALTAHFESNWPPGFNSKPTSLLEMDKLLGAIDKPEAIVATYNDIEGTTQTKYKIWE